MPVPCPTRDSLQQFSGGHLEEVSAAEIATHVDSCANCRTTLEELSASSGAMLAALRTPVELPFASESALQHALVGIKAIALEATSASQENISPGVAANLPVLKTIRDYEILQKLGEGGMGAVYKARHSRLKKIVALKVLPRDREVKPEIISRFEREMEAVGKLEHPNLVRAMDAGDVDGTHFLVMEYVGGPDLSQLVKQHGALPIADACELIRQAAVGLQHVHEQGLVHRDIKPSNLMLSPQGTVKILDLGLALLANEAGRELTTTGQMMGTIDYMAPEQGGDTHHVDIRADIYSLGATLYKLLCGVAPFGDDKFDTPVKKLMALASQEPTPIKQRRPDVPAGLATVIAKMLAKEPKNRYATPAAVVAALAPFAAGAELTPYVDQTNDSSRGKGTEDTYPSLKSASVNTQAPQPIPVASGSSRRRTLIRNLVLAGFAAAILLAGITFFIPTGKGYVKVTINDPKVTVKFNSTGATIDGADEKPIDLKFGDQEIEIKRGDFKFTTTRFKLEKKGVTTLDVQFLPGELKVVYDGQQLERIPLPQIAGAATPAVPASAMAVAQPDYALRFNGTDALVEVPSLTYDGSHPLTIEARVQMQGASPEDVGSIAGWHGLISLTTWENTSFSVQAFDSAKQIIPLAFRLNPAGRDHSHQLAVVFNGQEVRLFVDGVAGQKEPLSKMRNLFLETGIYTDHFAIGSYIAMSHAKKRAPESFFQGLIDEVRISKIARYDKDYNPKPRLEADADTLALYHFDEGTGDVLRDASKNGHHGKIVKAEWVNADGSAIAAPNPPRYGLKFDGNDLVDVRGIDWGPLDKYTLEAFVCPERHADKAGFVVYCPKNAELALNFAGSNGGWFLCNKYKDEDKPFYAYGLTEAELNKRVHLAGVANGRQFRLFANGTLVGSSIAARDLKPGLGDRLIFGTDYMGTIDGIRISRSARYDGVFAPPPHFEKDADTLALYHFREGTDKFLLDSSGNGHDGSIEGAEWVRVDGSAIEKTAPVPAIVPFGAAQAEAYQKAWATHLGIPVEYSKTKGVNLRLIPPGECELGLADKDHLAMLSAWDKPGVEQAYRDNVVASVRKHRVRLTQPFYLATMEFPRSEYIRLSNTLPTSETRRQSGDVPISHTSWFDAVKVCNALSESEGLAPYYKIVGQRVEALGGTGYRLPTSAEWEFAFRAGSATDYPWPEGEPATDHAWLSDNSQSTLQVRGQKKPNAFGLFDMAGNVSEWCWDYFDRYERMIDEGALVTDPTGPLQTRQYRVTRGGSHASPPDVARAWYRFGFAEDKTSHTGFRVARTIATTKQP